MSPQPVEPWCKTGDRPDSLILGLMTKYWDVGQVKTRLGASIGMERAAKLHRLFISHLCTSLADVAEQRIACLSPDPSDGRFEDELRSWGLDGRWRTMPQGDGNLGARMERWFRRCLGDHVSRHAPDPPSSMAILIGGDCPLLDAKRLAHAAQLLERRDVVLGPAADGGYYLIGIRGPWQSRQACFETLFRDIPWSTPQVLRVTRERVKSAGLSLAELEICEDVDTAVELNHLREFLMSALLPGESDRSGQTAAPARTTGLAYLKAGIDRIMGGESLDPDSSDRVLT